jgi:ATP-dependent RNA helicase DHX29
LLNFNTQTKRGLSHPANSVSSNSETANVQGVHNDLEATEKKSASIGNVDEGSDLKKAIPKDVHRTYTKEVDEEVVELDNMFFEAMFSDRIIEASRMTTDQTTNRD